MVRNESHDLYVIWDGGNKKKAITSDALNAVQYFI